MKEVTVIIPAHNEEKHIGIVIEHIKKEEVIKEIIVVANSCNDNTEIVAKKAGAKVIRCMKKGKGYAMEAGLKRAKGQIIAFLDGDIINYMDNVVTTMVKPIIKGKVDFVKTKFDREGGRVTELLAKPLLEILFPELAGFSQPLSGTIACRKVILEQMVFDKDYGVDIGILLDSYNMGARIKEVHIGNLKNDSQDWKSLTKMSKQVAEAILKRTSYIPQEVYNNEFRVIEQVI